MDVRIFMLRQDDPAKCTAAMLVKFGMAKRVSKTSQSTLLLDPFAERTVLKSDEHEVDSITAIDCSWELARGTFSKRFQGLPRKLPPLLAGNPVNYSKMGKLTTAESLSAALFIMGLDEEGHSVLNKFKWGHTFYDLNQDLLRDYSAAKTQEEILAISHEYGIAALPLG